MISGFFIAASNVISYQQYYLTGTANSHSVVEQKLTAFANPNRGWHGMKFQNESFHYKVDASIIIKGTLQSMLAYAAALGPLSANAQHHSQTRYLDPPFISK